MTREDAARQIDVLADFYRRICELAAFLHS